MSWCSMMETCVSKLSACFFEYQTPRFVVMQTKPIGLLYRLVQLALLVYLIGYVFVYTKSYQRFDTADSSVVTRITGVLLRNNSGKMEVWDNNDFVVPAQESNAFFIATNLLYTSNQSQGVCPEDASIGHPGIACVNDSDCTSGIPTRYGNGIKTGGCVNHTGTCEVNAWCPTEVEDAPSEPVLRGMESVKVLIKNHIAFPKFNIKRRNVLAWFSEKYLKMCRFHPVKDPLCPVFAVRDMVTFANENFDEMAVKGGIIGFNIKWNCDLDQGPQNCLPEYSFRRLDSVQDKVAKGWSFRHAYYHYDRRGQARRDLVKYWGIRFVVLVSGRAGEFSTVHFAMHLGSSIGLFGLASLICEMAIGCCYYSNVLLQEQKCTRLESMKARRNGAIKRPAKPNLHSSTFVSFTDSDIGLSYLPKDGCRTGNHIQPGVTVLLDHPDLVPENGLPLSGLARRRRSSVITIDGSDDQPM